MANKYSIERLEFDSEFCSKFPLKRLKQIIGTEFDNSHYYFLRLTDIKKSDLIHIANDQTKIFNTPLVPNYGSTNYIKSEEKVKHYIREKKVCSFKSKDGERLFEIYFNGESILYSLFDFEFDDDKISDQGFMSIVKLIDKKMCFEHSVPFFSIKEILKSGNYVLTNKHIFTSLAEVIMFSESV